MLDSIEICSAAHPDASIIWLHGLGADGSDFVPVAQELALPFAVRFVFPHAPVMPVTINGGYVMPAWYDIVDNDIAGNQDEAGIRMSAAELDALIENEQFRGVAANRIVLAGFSQGGAIVLQAALRYPKKLAGVLALSTYLPLAAKLDMEKSAANLALPIFMAHGVADTVIPMMAAARSGEQLVAQGYEVEWHEYPMAHSVCPQEIDDIRRFLLQVLG
jgi:phospholipase/carboxylesterase